MKGGRGGVLADPRGWDGKETAVIAIVCKNQARKVAVAAPSPPSHTSITPSYPATERLRWRTFFFFTSSFFLVSLFNHRSIASQPACHRLHPTTIHSFTTPPARIHPCITQRALCARDRTARYARCPSPACMNTASCANLRLSAAAAPGPPSSGSAATRGAAAVSCARASARWHADVAASPSACT